MPGIPIVLYRGDSRPADVIKRDGFEIWGDALAAVSKAKGIANYINMKCAELKDSASFRRFVVAEKNRARPTISTSRDQGCGGYDGGNIYCIEYDESANLQEYDLVPALRAPLGSATFNNTIGKGGKGIRLFMDQPLLASAKIIIMDLNIETTECVFLTKVSKDNIRMFRAQGHDNYTPFNAMPNAAARKKLW